MFFLPGLLSKLRGNDPDLTLFKTTGVVETIRKIINETTPETIIAKHHNTEPLAFRELKEAPLNNQQINHSGRENMLGGAYRPQYYRYIWQYEARRV